MLPKSRDNLPPETTLFGNYAGFISRMIAFILDNIFCTLLVISIFGVSSITENLFQIRRMLEILTNYAPLIEPAIVFLYSGSFHTITAISIVIIYQVIFIFLAGQTPAKRLIGLRVVSYGSERIPLWRAIFRYFGYFISALPLGLGFFWILIDDRRMAWHDKLAGTHVLYAWNARPEEVFLKQAIQTLISLQAVTEETRAQRHPSTFLLRKDKTE